jgi:hypothetical protein
VDYSKDSNGNTDFNKIDKVTVLDPQNLNYDRNGNYILSSQDENV